MSVRVFTYKAEAGIITTGKKKQKKTVNTAKREYILLMRLLNRDAEQEAEMHYSAPVRQTMKRSG